MLTSEGHCSSCTRQPEAPYRRHDQHGKVVEGCVDECHTGHLYGESLRWHNRPGAKAIRKSAKAHLKHMLHGSRSSHR